MTQPTHVDVPAPPTKASRDPRFTVMVVSGFLALLLGAAAILLPAPYVVESPGPTFNTIGEIDSQPLIEVEGRETFPTSGDLDLTTVYVTGGPGTQLGIFEVFRAWLDPTESVVPRELRYPPDVTQEDIQEQNAVAMTSSQESAIAAALAHLDIEFEEELSVAGLVEDAAATGILEEGDVITSVDGTEVTNIGVLRSSLNAANGESVDIGLLRDGGEVTEAVTPKESPEGDFQLGVGLVANFTFPFDITIALDNVGGPSAGSMFALGIVDLLTEGELTGGKHFAGTGTIDSAGTVGPIGGIRQKLAGAREAGAEVFLAPAANCDEVVGHVPDGLQVVRVETLNDAVAAVSTLGAGNDGADLPTCEAG
ncbi:S16 family serine protease [Arthrobacter sp. 260]|uniref:YlbL family protein n=1 Tax=Arthrobacter sp. 260 TaxID=2735314 RepID=UPI00149300AF|nr:S16 family serine protease [Arthrobacter sp. 260]NOJ58508.1 signal protein PDZ [Arthrobacter sp. 260]